MVDSVAALLRLPAIRRRALSAGARRGVSFVLVYHRVGPDGPAPHEIVPTLASSRFEAQVRALADLGDLVSLPQLLDPPQTYDRPRFAITFDDDHTCHVRHVLPILDRLGVSATFFLSGRAMHDLPPYWWIPLEESIRTEGLAGTCSRLGLKSDSLPALLAQLEPMRDLRGLTARLPRVEGSVMSVDDIRTLARAGMTIGFHTLHHPMLTMLAGSDLEQALTWGKQELADVSGQAVDLLAYPYGQCNAQVADAARRAGFRAAFRTGGLPNTHHSDGVCLGRWDPEQRPAASFASAVTLRLLRNPTSAFRREPAVAA